MLYISIFEDGAILQSSKEPTEEDFGAVDNGYLDLIRVKDNKAQSYYESEWHDVDSAETE